MNKKAFIINSLLFLSLALSIIAIKHFMDFSAKKPDSNSAHRPDAYMLNASYLRTNDQGKHDIVLIAPLVTHFKHQDTSFFQEPKIFIYKNEEEWRVTAKKAKGINGATTFFLSDNVKVRQLATPKRVGTVLTTQSLTVFPKKNVVSTNEFVTIEQPGLKINSVGMRGDLNTGNIKLLSKTRGQYDPKQAR